MIAKIVCSFSEPKEYVRKTDEAWLGKVNKMYYSVDSLRKYDCEASPGNPRPVEQ